MAGNCQHALHSNSESGLWIGFCIVLPFKLALAVTMTSPAVTLLAAGSPWALALLEVEPLARALLEVEPQARALRLVEAERSPRDVVLVV